MWARSVSSARRNLRRAGRLKKIWRTSMVVPAGDAAAFTSTIFPPFTTTWVASPEVSSRSRVVSTKRLTLAMLGRASPRNPMVAMEARSSARVILEVAWRSRHSRASSRLMPRPSSVTRMRLRPPVPISTVMRVAPASREFSTSSFTTLAGRSTTSPAAIWFATCSGSSRIRFTSPAWTVRGRAWSPESGRMRPA